MDKIKVMIVDDHLVVREGLRQLLEIEDDIEVVAEAGNGLECLEMIEKSRPDLLFMDVRMPGISGIEATRQVCRRHPQVKVIMLTIYEDDQYVRESIRAGAKGYVLKKVGREELIRIVRDVMEDRAFLDPKVAPAVFDHVKGRTSTTGKETALTQRELEILQHIAEGNGDRAIAESLHISEHTVRSHIKNLYRKLGVSSRAQAVAKALREGIIATDS
jgi:NarL family two-component system response regulator YdfI